MAPTSSCTSANSRSARAGIDGPRDRVAGQGAQPDEASVAPAGEPLPERLGDERHDRVQQPQRHVEGPEHDGARHIAAGRVAVEPRLDRLDVPVGEVAPEEVVDRGGRLVEPEPLVGLGGASRTVASHRAMIHRSASVSSSGAQRRRGEPGERPGRAVEVGQDEAAGVPELVGEVAPGRERGLEVVGIEDHVGAHRHARDRRCSAARRRRSARPPRAGRSRCPATWTSCDAGCRARCRGGRRCGTGCRP